VSTPISPQSNNDDQGPQLYRKPRADVLTVLLVIAFLAILLATLALWQTMKDYNYKLKGGPSVLRERPAASSLYCSHSVMYSSRSA
jgi:hypothetical protein